MEVKEISHSQLVSHLKKYHRWVYTQGSYFAAAKAKLGNPVECLGIFSDKSLIGTAVVYLVSMPFGLKIAKCLFGPMILSTDSKEFAAACKTLGNYYKKKSRVIRLAINPYVVRRHYKDITPGSYENFAFDLDLELKKSGFIPEKEEYYENPYVQVRFQYVKCLDGLKGEDVMPSLSVETREAIAKGKRHSIKVRDAVTAEDFDICKSILEATHSSRLNNQPYPKIVNYMRCNFDDNYRLKLAYLDCQDAINSYSYRFKRFKSKIPTKAPKVHGQSFRVSALLPRRLSERMSTILKKIKCLSDLQAEKGNIINIAACLFVYGGEEIMCRFSGCYEEYEGLEPLTMIHYIQLKEACQKGCKYYNFYAISGLFDDLAPDSKLLHFKRGFHGNCEELIRTYYYRTSPFFSKVFTK